MFRPKRRGSLFILSAPSGAGKSTLCGMAVKETENLRYSISCTTRPPRPGEKNGVNYFFMTERDFARDVRKNKFLESATVHGNSYGTPEKFVRDSLKAGHDLIMDIDVQGGLNIKKRMPEAVLIFILAPSISELRKRLQNRKQDSGSVIALRMKNALSEMRRLPEYDYLIVNDDLGRAFAELVAIISAERCRVSRYALGKAAGLP